MTSYTSPQPPLPLTPELTLQQAITHHLAGRLQEAGVLYQAILQSHPAHAEANHHMGVLALESEEAANALPYLLAALEAEPAHGPYWLSYINALIRAGQMDAAREVLSIAQQQGLQGDEVVALAVFLNNASQAAEQANVVSNGISNESLPTASIAFQNKKQKSKPVKQELSAFNAKANPAPEEISSLLTLFGEGRYAETATLAQSMTLHYPIHGFGWKVLGAVYKQLGRNADALIPMQKAAALSQNDAEAHANLGIILKDLGRLEEAESSFKTALKLKPDYANAHNNLGATLQEMGRTEEAEFCYRRALEISPDFVAAHYNLGATLLKLGRLVDAESSYRRALEIHPGYAEAHHNLGTTLKNMRRLDEAVTSYRRALEIKPDYAEAHHNLGSTLNELGLPDEAVWCYRQALEFNPNYAEAYNNLGITLQGLGRLEEAETSYRRALEIKPDYAEAHNNLSVTLQDLGRLIEAEASYRCALEINPDLAEATYNLGGILRELSRLNEAEAIYRRALEIKPDYAEAYNNLGATLHELGRLDEAKSSYQMAHKLGYYGAHVKEALMIPSIISSKQNMLEGRAIFERNLEKLIADNVAIADPLHNIGGTNFYMAYHGLNDRDLQIKMAKYYAQVCPSLLYTAPHCIKPKSATHKKIRVGFFSRFLYSHSVSRCYSKIIEKLSLNEQFEVTLISNQVIDKKIYAGFAGNCVLLPYHLARAREMLAALELDILVYLDIGMEPLSYFLAFSRLARAQCVLAGHPVTTGIANIDYFLSTEQIEPAGAQAHYSEKLICLPQLLVYFARPTLPAKLKTRRELNFPEGRHIYICPMKLHKIHPDFDDAISRILHLDATGIIILFEDDMWPYWKPALMARFENSIPAEARERIIFLPWIKEAVDFISAIAVSDVVLDPFHFGIGSTAVMTFVTGTPLVTRTGEFMRGRFGAYFCEMLDTRECIAEDTESYARKAVEIASDRLLREKISRKILKNNAALYENMQPVDDFIDFLSSLTDKG